MLKRKKPLQRRTGLSQGKKGLKRSGFKKAGFAKTRSSEPESPPADAIKIAAERKLWPLLRDSEICGLRFQLRQLAGPYLVDFLCPAAKLLLEITPGQDSADDLERREALRALGYRILSLDAQSILDDPLGTLARLNDSFTLRAIARSC